MTKYPETIVYVKGESVWCMGEAMDHPKVYYSVPEEGYVKCNYCDIKFIREKERKK
ncbi:MAG: zinc-finger domain-containing protein [Euryarchaeota archaeon]|nr:zinc-finger domain-containing protein [Euryarchaeota archaeon]